MVIMHTVYIIIVLIIVFIFIFIHVFISQCLIISTCILDKTSFKVVDRPIVGKVNVYLSVDNYTTATPHGYTLRTDLSSHEILIKGKTATGVFNGIQTLLSLLSGGNSLVRVHIIDEPRFQFRSMHLDIARNFRTKATILKLIDAMAMYKLNKLHLHASDDEGWRLEIKDLPELTDVCHQ